MIMNIIFIQGKSKLLILYILDIICEIWTVRSFRNYHRNCGLFFPGLVKVGYNFGCYIEFF